MCRVLQVRSMCFMRVYVFKYTWHVQSLYNNPLPYAFLNFANAHAHKFSKRYLSDALTETRTLKNFLHKYKSTYTQAHSGCPTLRRPITQLKGTHGGQTYRESGGTRAVHNAWQGRCQAIKARVCSNVCVQLDTVSQPGVRRGAVVRA